MNIISIAYDIRDRKETIESMIAKKQSELSLMLKKNGNISVNITEDIKETKIIIESMQEELRLIIPLYEYYDNLDCY